MDLTLRPLSHTESVRQVTAAVFPSGRVWPNREIFECEVNPGSATLVLDPAHGCKARVSVDFAEGIWRISSNLSSEC